MSKPRIKMPKKKPFIGKPKLRRPLPDKVGKVKKIYDLKGNLLMIGTESEWRRWAQARR